ncbi:MAG TPA: hypothetical protein VGR98_12310 [Streptosporangiaceae bacterium]|nr:hypothetical protein [Streptosporangiaceae bacterium]
MGLFTLAWLIGEGIIVFRSVRANHAPPMPGALIASSGIFALLALLAESDSARPLAIALAYGFDLAAFMNLAPSITGGGAAGPAKPKPGATGTTQAPHTSTAGGRG